ncbi:MAG: type II toxin-antitoxin system Phd/YefM family antitoxin [Alphaproteobacteria bacterium]|nr:type II toxin-antitoxin system Phd/YefM family antitoxin [Alphaproteobacteria bacterium]
MTRTVNIYEAKTNLSRLVEQAAAGEEIVIAKAGKPLARLSPLRDGRGPRKPGCLAGLFHVSDDFDAPLPDDLLDEFEGRPG